MLKMARSGLVIAVLAVATGCTTLTSGRNFDYPAFGSKVQVGSTDASQVRQWLGEPAAIGVEVNADGTRNEVWSYYYFTGKLPTGSNIGFKLLQVKVNPQGKVAGYVWTGEAGSAQVEDKSSKK